MILLLYLITPFLGSLRNYIKYKQLHLFVFLRSPIIYFCIHLLFPTITVWEVLIYERWFLFMYKSIISLYYDDYHRKKNKYIKKYGLHY